MLEAFPFFKGDEVEGDVKLISENGKNYILVGNFAYLKRGGSLTRLKPGKYGPIDNDAVDKTDLCDGRN